MQLSVTNPSHHRLMSSTTPKAPAKKPVLLKTKVAINRREHIRRIIALDGGSPVPLADRLGYANPSFIVQLAGPNPSRNVTEKAARAMEETLGLPEGSMDEPPAPLPDGVEPYPQYRGRSAPAGHDDEKPARADVKGYAGPDRRQSSAPSPTGRPQASADTQGVTNVIRLVGEILDSENVNLPPAKFADLVALAYVDSIEHDGKAREDHVRSLVRLVK